MSEDSMQTELDYIKQSVDEIKRDFKTFMERDEARNNRINDIETKLKLSEKDEMTCRADNKKEFDAMHNAFREHKAETEKKLAVIEEMMPTLEKTKRSLKDWSSLIVSVGQAIVFICAAIVVIYKLFYKG